MCYNIIIQLLVIVIIWIYYIRIQTDLQLSVILQHAVTINSLKKKKSHNIILVKHFKQYIVIYIFISLS